MESTALEPPVVGNVPDPALPSGVTPASGTPAPIPAPPRPGRWRVRARRALRWVFQGGILSDKALALVDQGVFSATNFATSVLVGRATGEDGLGLFALALSVVLFVRGIQGQIIAAPFVIYRAGRGDEESRYAGSCLLHQIAVIALTSAGLVAAAAGYLWFDPGSEIGRMLALLAALAPVLLLRDFVRSVIFAHLEMRVALLFDGTVSVIQVGGLLALTAIGQLTVPATYLCMTVGCLAALLGWTAWRRLEFRFDPQAAWTDWLENWRFGRWTLASHLLGSCTPYVMPWVVASVDSRAAAGVLAAATTLVGPANLLVMGISNYLTPKAAAAYRESGTAGLRAVLWQTAIVLTLLIGTFCVAAWLLGESAAGLIYNGQFTGIGPVIGVLALGMLANALGMTVGNGLWAVERPEMNLAADIVAVVVVVAATAALIVPLGPLGAALATCLSTTLATLVRWATLHIVLAEIDSSTRPALVEEVGR